MTQSEKQTVEALQSQMATLVGKVESLIRSNKEMAEALTQKVEAVQKQSPISMELQILNALEDGLNHVIKEKLSGYHSPLQGYVTAALAPYEQDIIATLKSGLGNAISSDQFKQMCEQHLASKIAKTLIAGLDGSVDKVVNQVKQDPIYRSRLTLFVNQLVEDYLAKKPCDTPSFISLCLVEI